MAERIPSIPEQATGALTQRLIAVEDIEGGEATLLALVAEEPSCLLVIGDLRALRALSKADELADVREQLKGKILSTEVCLKLLLRAKGHSVLTRAFKSIRGVDRKLSVLFSDSN